VGFPDCHPSSLDVTDGKDDTEAAAIISKAVKNRTAGAVQLLEFLEVSSFWVCILTFKIF
jgi:hypothetical protein